MFSKANCATFYGMEGILCQAEVDISDGLPGWSMVGYLSSEVREAKERVRISLKNAGYRLQPKKVTINIAPADIRKSGTAFDLSVGMAILAGYGYIPAEVLQEVCLIGELGLDGNVQQVKGVLPMLYAARTAGITRAVIPKENEMEGKLMEDMEVYVAQSVAECVHILNNMQEEIPIQTLRESMVIKEEILDTEMDFSEIVGQECVKRAIAVAVAGKHNLLMIGSPGSGKTLLAKRIPTIMPKLTYEEMLEIMKIYSVAGLCVQKEKQLWERPFRNPHHTISAAALIGGGTMPGPGEITLASGGVLFLDEIAEFSPNILDMLRQPLEDTYVQVSRQRGKHMYPADFMLVAAMNPCKCGYYPDRERCRCSIQSIEKYMGRISTPLLDRIDITAYVSPVEYKDLQQEKSEINTRQMKEWVERARNMQKIRFLDENILWNKELNGELIKKYCKLDAASEAFLSFLFRKHGFSARGYYRILRVARTIADMELSDNIQLAHVKEAAGYRGMER